MKTSLGHWKFAAEMGPSWVATRAAYELRRRSGLLRWRMPAQSWDAHGLPRIAPRASPARVLEEIRQSAFRISPPGASASRSRGVVEEADDLLDGRWSFFGGLACDVGFPPEWHRHPASNERWPHSHWTLLSDASLQDVKWLWELGRFGVVYPLARAHALTEDAKYPEGFWTLVEAWRQANPPNIGVHWMCGQECAYRAIAWTFALLAFAEHPSTTPERAGRLVEMLAAHGDRIEANLAYARSQKNNHGVNEALGLWTIGIVFPMLAASARWERLGRDVLEEEAQRQIYCDGAYVQQSLGYHRLVLESYAWAIEFGRKTGRPFSDVLVARCASAARLLYQLSDPSTGRMPNYGSNDGSRLLRLDSCASDDARPAVALALWASARTRVFPDGPWDEPMRWLSNDAPSLDVHPEPRVDLAADDGGYYTLRNAETWGFVRCAHYRDRPAQADMLHVDLWWRGQNIVADPGTYSYSAPPPWNNGLAATAVHNTPTVDGLDQMERVSRFAWSGRNEGRVVQRSTDGGVKRLAMTQDGFVRRAGVTHRRTVTLDGGRWTIADEFEGDGTHDLHWQWLLWQGRVTHRSANTFDIAHPAGSFQISFSAEGCDPLAIAPAPGSPSSVYGWYAPTYLMKQESLALLVSTQGAMPARVVTTIRLG